MFLLICNPVGHTYKYYIIFIILKETLLEQSLFLYHIYTGYELFND